MRGECGGRVGWWDGGRGERGRGGRRDSGRGGERGGGERRDGGRVGVAVGMVSYLAGGEGWVLAYHP